MCKLLKGLYSIKQGSNLFQGIISEDLVTAGFERMPSLPCLLVHRFKTIIVVVYVNEGLVACKEKDGIDYSKVLKSVYEITELSEAS